jgi:hypothetical protein
MIVASVHRSVIVRKVIQVRVALVVVQVGSLRISTSISDAEVGRLAMLGMASPRSRTKAMR